jgi:hypothetical protein
MSEIISASSSEHSDNPKPIRKIKETNEERIARLAKHGVKEPNREELIRMLTREEEIRMSQEYVDKCDAVASVPNGWLEVSAAYQVS